MNSLKNVPVFFICLLFTVLSFTSCKDDEIQSNQLIVNGILEQGSTSPDGWWSNSANPDNFNFIWTEDESFSGSKSVSISTQTADASAFAYWGQTITNNLPTGKSVTLSVRIKGELSGRGVTVALRGDDTVEIDGSAEQFATTQGSMDISGTFDWKEYSIKLDNVDASTKSLTVYLIYLYDTSGEAYFDDVSLTY
ncbi:hypothetical protein [Marivirga sp.]|uniref:hypothetical protein n=1 Tax=Marivirga sp. TaxID=2018662 RepID=UPI0025D8FEE6|nr:hypothetical protein [Marivirga sp.]